MKKFVFTSGDINGIGPEITIRTLNEINSPGKYKLIYTIPSNIFESTIKIIKPKFKFEVVNKITNENCGNRLVTVLNLGRSVQNYGKPTKTSGKISYKSLKQSFQLVRNGFADAMITAPISKIAMKKAGYNFPGHTELLAEWSESKNFVMMFVGRKMNSALITIHEPISKVPKLLSKKKIQSKIEIVLRTLERDFGIVDPQIALLGLNPHAGEEGRFGKEELIKIRPAIEMFGNNVYGPFVPDAFFGMKLYNNFDIVIGMYHDQVLIPFKMMSFDSGVNYTAGLPIVRTSPDHGTAYDIAGKGLADPKSLIEAFKVAKKIVTNRAKVK